MNPRLTVIADARGGWFSRTDALSCGYADSTIRNRTRTGRWLRLCRDAYVEPATWPEENRWDRARRLHTLAARVVLDRAGPSAALSHQTAVVIHGLPDWRLDLSRVHVTKATGRAGTAGSVVRHRSAVPTTDVTHVGGLRVTAPARSVVETACGLAYPVAVVLFDACIRGGLASADQIAAMADRLSHWAGAPVARAAAGFADGRSESVGESRLRVILADHGFPEPELQAELTDDRGEFIARVDFLFPDQRVVVEFDGMVKYQAETGAVVMAEKRREDRIREQGYVVVRITWAELSRPVDLIQRIRQAFALAGRTAA